MSHTHEHEEDSGRLGKLLTFAAAILFVVPFILGLLKIEGLEWLYYFSLAAGGTPVAIAAVKSLFKRKVTINLLVTIAAVGAVYLGEIAEAAIVVLFFSLAEAFEAYGEARSKRAVESLLKRSPKTARLKVGDDTVETSVDLIEKGQTVVVRPGDMVPLDGVVTSGESSINEAAITGESVPKEKYKNESVYAGTLNLNGYLEIKVTNTVGNTTLAKIARLIEDAQESRPEMQSFLDKFAGFYIPIAIGAAVLTVLIPVAFFGQPLDEWFGRGLVLLVLACPDALVVSAPVAIAAAIGGASRRGVLIKGGRFLEVLSKTKAVAFDKTKTLTMGVPTVAEVHTFNGASEADVIGDAAGLEKFSSHPLASAIESYAKENGLEPHEMESYSNTAGRGGNANCLVCDGLEHAVGNLEHIGANAKKNKTVLEKIEQLEAKGMTTVLVSEGDKVIGVIGIVDQLRSESKGVIDALKRLKVVPVMLTGDNTKVAQSVAKEVGIKEVYGSLLPEEKESQVRRLQKEYGYVAMVGDGVNDAPSLARADVGIAMGGGGSDVAIETADITLMNDAIKTVPYLLELGQQTFRVVRQNVYGSLIVKGAILVTSFIGLTNLTFAVTVDAITAILVVLNGLRLFQLSKRDK